MTLNKNMRHRIFYSYPVVMLLALFGPSTAARPNIPLAVAVIADKRFELHKSPLVSLLEVKLSQEPGVVLLERAEIEKILEEQMLQLAFEAEGSEARRQLGALLRARMLVILRAREEQAGEDKTIRCLELVIADTSTGLRILTEKLVWNESKPDEAAGRIARHVDRTRAILSEAIRAVVAVPLFVCEDFTYDYASLKGVYPEVIRHCLEAMRGVQVVEIDEAHAIAKELALSAGGSVRRPLRPYFILGRYRNVGEGTRHRVRVTLQLKQGEKVVSEKTSADLAPESVAGFLRSAAAALLNKAINIRAPAFDAAEEVQQFKRRAHEYEELEEYEQAFNLIQAALLVQPETSLYEYAIRLCTKFISSAHEDRGGADDFEARAFKAAAANLIGIDYAEHLMRMPGFNFESREKTRPISSFFYCGYGIYNPLQYTHNAQLRRAVESVAIKKRQVVISFLESLLEKGKLTTAMVRQGPWRPASFPMPGGFRIRESYPEHLAAKFRYIRILSAVPGLSDRICWTILHEHERGGGDRSEADAKAMQHFLDRVARLPGHGSKVIAAYYRMLETTTEKEQQLYKLDSLIHHVRTSGLAEDDEPLMRYLEWQRGYIDGSAFRNLVPPQDPPVGEIRRSHIDELTMAFPDHQPLNGGKFSFLETNIGGCVRCDGDIDLYWTTQLKKTFPSRIFRMRTKASLEQIHTTTEGGITSMIYDGRYAWAAQEGRLLIIDPQTSVVDAVTQDDGLLPGKIRPVPVAPGFVCAIGYFGRTWCANVLCDDAGEKSVDVFHKAALPKGDALDPAVVFELEHVVRLYDPAEPGRPVILATRGKPQSWYPLLVDPLNRTVRVLPVAVSCRYRHSYAVHEGAFYWCDQPESTDEDDYDFKLLLCRLAPPDFRKEVITRHDIRGSGLRAPLVFFAGERCFLVCTYCWLVDRQTGTLSPVIGKRPGNDPFQFCADGPLFAETNHYGLILLPQADRPHRVTQVDFQEVSDVPADVFTRQFETDVTGGPAREQPDEGAMAEIARSMIEAETARAAKLSARASEQPVSDNPGTRTIGGRYQVKEYYHTFLFESEDGRLLDAAQAGVQYMDVPHAHLNQKEILQGGYFPIGTFEVINPSPKYEPITVTPASPERLVFRLKRDDT